MRHQADRKASFLAAVSRPGRWTPAAKLLTANRPPDAAQRSRDLVQPRLVMPFRLKFVLTCWDISRLGLAGRAEHRPFPAPGNSPRCLEMSSRHRQGPAFPARHQLRADSRAIGCCGITELLITLHFATRPTCCSAYAAEDGPCALEVWDQGRASTGPSRKSLKGFGTGQPPDRAEKTIVRLALSSALQV